MATRLLLLLLSLALVAPDAFAPASSRLRRSRIARSDPPAGRDLRGLLKQVRGGGEAKAAEEEVARKARVDRSRRGFYPKVYDAIPEPEGNGYGREERSAFCVQQVQGTGDCLFHSIAIGMAFEDESSHLDMYDPSLSKRVEKLRQQAVDALVEDPKRVLHIEVRRGG